jgi:5'-3' exonuclease
MATYILVDTMNLFFRAKHVGGGKDIDLRVGMAMHIMFSSVRKAWNDFNGSHVVFCLDGRSWRKDVYPPYKANRKVTQAKRTAREIEDDEIFFESYKHLVEYLDTKTNCTVMHNAIAEADDLIATWIQTHPADQHVIVSTDSDFYQLLSDNVRQYNGVTDQIIAIDGITDGRTGKPVIDKKTGKLKEVPDPDWLLFEKCIRGDTSDNIFSAYPGARKKGTKNKVGMLEAFSDRERGGFAYNNFMLQRWTDHEDREHLVRDDYDRNRTLIDLTAQPDDIKESCRQTILEAINKEKVTNVGIYFMKFTGRHNLMKLSEQATEMGKILNAGIQDSTCLLTEETQETA